MEFLFEIGLEEVPARMIAAAQTELQRRVVALLERERLVAPGTESKSFSTPRRLAVLVGDVAEKQDDIAEELLGPSTKIAFKDGQPTPAALAFAKKAGVAVEDLKTVTNAKGEYVAATVTKAGRAAVEVIATELPKELAGIYWAKNMYWRPGKPERFVRPVRWLLALLDGDVIPVAFAGYNASNVTYGHRVLHGAAPVEIDAPTAYEHALLDAKVMADVELRRHTIRKALDRVCRTVPDTRWREDHELVDKLTHLTEWPSVIAGGFDPEFLALPEEVLVTVMRDHQSYFAVEDTTGKLAPHFLAVLNTVATEAGDAVIRHGNERVLRARFNDARFFWEFDQRTPLHQRREMLEHVTFQKDLGSYADKAERVMEVCAQFEAILARKGFCFDAPALELAAKLAKCDLTTELVKEFTELQGIIGGLYARADFENENTVDAIYDQYRPTSMEDRIARTVEGQLLSIADRIDTISGMFSIGLEPTGSKDPFALRRAANGIVKTLAESAIPLSLSEIASATNAPQALLVKIAAFFTERLDFYLREVEGNAYDVVKAVLAADANDVRNAVKRAAAVTAMRGSDDFVAVSAAFKRMKNILVQAKTNVEGSVDFSVEGRPAHAAEIALVDRAGVVGEEVKKHTQESDYRSALEAIATLRPEVDAFFNQVMIMDPNVDVRIRRLLMLERLVATFSGIADFSEIVTSG